MAFSGALTLTDLNDFLTPSQACIKPVEQVNEPQDIAEPGTATTEIVIDSSGLYYEVSATGASTNVSSKGAGRKLQQAQISLNDCLACSGCITSAESVLITLQSHTEVLNFLDSIPPVSTPGHKIPVLSIAPQSLASLAASLSSSSGSPVSLRQILRRVRAFSTRILGFEHVYDTTFARHIALLEHTQEFFERKKGNGKLPMLASACPGWICYAEKAHSEMLPFIARTKSPQQVMGTLVKSWFGNRWGVQPDQIYHVSVMPCYDKKLEASRQDFYNDLYSTRDVDCVITTGELELMMRDKGWDLSQPVENEDIPDFDAEIPELLSHPGTSSGSYLHSLINSITTSHTSPVDLTIKSIRTSDYEEFTLRTRDTGEVLFKGAKCYGFRNLQNVVRKVGREAGVQVGRGAAGRLVGMRAKKRGGEDEKGYDYVEVMACPGGCVNGGGQLKPIAQAAGQKEDEEGFTRNWEESGVQMLVPGEDSAMQGVKWGNKEWTKEVERVYWHDLPTPPPSPRPHDRDLENPFVCADRLAAQVKIDLCHPTDGSLHENWASIMDEGAETQRRELFRTQYRAVESEVVGLAVKW
ncbi:iron hydrogenase [Suillus subaureus]|uniref:Cytosolic Fe-S cluster assembly factor NAR1 n=1 Tax=Suillus subaureus TaxID=48587 RepID=A0A9P7EAJ6_9AGAM|nr:iron hydrogenase [Suillus subaureus]KAG1815943.1 iron hydrogenase [Suillus subaureus]